MTNAARFIMLYTICALPLCVSTLVADELPASRWEYLEARPEFSKARIAAHAMQLPVQLYLPGQAMMEVVWMENDTPIYRVIRNFRHPQRGAYLASYAEISAHFDLAGAFRRFYDGTVVNAHQDPIANSLTTRVNTDTLLMVMDSGNDRVMLLDPANGMLVDANFIPPNPTNLGTPVIAQQSPRGTISISDQIKDSVQDFDTTGGYQGVFAPAGGVNKEVDPKNWTVA